jgi:hypothetical protein
LLIRVGSKRDFPEKGKFQKESIFSAEVLACEMDLLNKTKFDFVANGIKVVTETLKGGIKITHLDSLRV